MGLEEKRAAAERMYVRLVEVKGWLTYLVSQQEEGNDRDNTLALLSGVAQDLAFAGGKVV